MGYMKVMLSKEYQTGAVSIFIVVFTALLITVVTVSFVRTMVRDQQQASTTDLSQSAYDSALAGVEDGKRALVRYLSNCPLNPEIGTQCYNWYSTFGESCDSVSTILGTASDNQETMIQSDASDAALNQAYTCAILTLDTDNYLGELAVDQTHVVPLVSTSPFDHITIEWFDQRDLTDGSTDVSLPTEPQLPLHQEWPESRPPVLETQLVQVSEAGFRLDNFDNVSGGTSNTNTLALYPSASGPSDNVLDFADNVRYSGAAGGPSSVRCDASVDAGNYACRVTIEVPDPVASDGDSNLRVAFLRLTPRYSGTNYRITMLNGAAIAQFNGVQPAIDVTARANDIFRRVETRVEASAILPYPVAAVQVTGNFCKTFSVTDSIDDYDGGACNPNSIP